jgi:hypothetical protein
MPWVSRDDFLGLASSRVAVHRPVVLLQLSPSFVLSDEHPASRYGAPVLILKCGANDPRAFQAPEMLGFGYELQPAAYWVARLGALKRKAADRAFCERFLHSWPSGPQTLRTFKTGGQART